MFSIPYDLLSFCDLSSASSPGSLREEAHNSRKASAFQCGGSCITGQMCTGAMSGLVATQAGFQYQGSGFQDLRVFV